MPRSFLLGLSLALASTPFAFAQDEGAVPQTGDQLVLLEYRTFDPLRAVPPIPDTLRGGIDLGLWIVQFRGPATDASRAAVRATGAQIHGYLPDNAYVVRMNHGTAGAVAGLGVVRWVGYYEPAFRLEEALVAEHLSGAVVPKRKYDMLVVDKRADKGALTAAILALGGTVVDRHEQSPLFTVELDGTQLLAAARLDQVLWIERWAPPGEDMNNARTQGGGNYVETQGGYTGAGIRGHVYEGAEATHSDFTTALTNVRSSGAAQAHGHCTAGIVFGNGTSAASARGMAPDARGYYTTYTSVSAGWSRNMVIGDVVNVHNCMFTTASWGGSQTTAYNATSADADDIVFDHRIPWTNSMSNLGDQRARPEAWAKNVISIGGVFHGNNSLAGDDTWNGGGSIGPAADTRIKPDLSSYYDQVWTSDLTGANGYSSGNSFTGFNGTSSATPIVAGHNALAIQMFTDHIFGNTPRVAAGTRFQNRPYAQTLKALMIATANQYPFTAASTDNRREHVGYGFPSLRNLWDSRNTMFVVPEDEVITQGATHSYLVNVGNGESRLHVCMTYLDPAGNPAAAFDRVNDLTVRVISPSGVAYWGNNGLTSGNFSTTGGSANTRDTCENVIIQNPAAGNWTVQVTAPTIAQDAHVATGATDATYALVVNGGIRVFGSGCARYFPDTGTTGGGNYIPFGQDANDTLSTILTGGNSGGVGGTVFFNVTVNSPMYVTGLDLNTTTASGNRLLCDVYRTVLGGGYGGNETNPAAWIAVSAGRGVSAGPNAASEIELTQPLFLPAGSYGIAIVARDFIHAYTNGNGSNQVYSDANLQIATGAASNGAFGGGVFSPRVANLNVRYKLESDSWTNQRYQTILRREELGSAGRITGLAFSPEVSGKHYNASLLIRMSHVPAGHTMSTTFATNMPSPVTMLNTVNHTWFHVANAWQEIGLQNGFNYNGTSDVVVEIVARGNVHTGAPAAFNNSPTQPRVFAYGWSGTTAPATGTTGTSSGLRMRVSFNCADGHNFGTSCGPLNASHSGSGARGTTFNFTMTSGQPSSLAFLVLGFNNGAPYPLSLTGSGFTNCTAWNDSLATNALITTVTGSSIYGLAIPNNAAFDGLRVYGHFYQLDASQPGGVTASNYVRMIVGLAP